MGTDKRHLSVSCVEGKSLMEHAGQMLASLCVELSVLVADSAEQGLPEGFTVHADGTPGAGPLAALADNLSGLRTPFALILPVDMPCLQHGQLQELMSLISQPTCTTEALFIQDESGRPTFPLVAKREFAASLAAEVRQGQVRLFQGLRAAGASGVTPDWLLPGTCGPDPLLNLNSPEDIETLESGLNSPRQ